MKKMKLLALSLSLATIPAIATPLIVLTSCSEKLPEITVPEITQDGTVVILATGGTIAGAGEAGKETGYKPGSISVESLIASVPGIEEIAPLAAEQVCNINSDDMNSKIWMQLARTINACADDDRVAGIVVLHGTDTMEETAYFLNLVVNTNKPVVITGSMRPATSISADGPMNLYQSVVVAANKESWGKGVLGVFSDSIFTARSMQKVSSFDVTAISAGPMGALGFVRNKEVFFYQESTKKHTRGTAFNSLVDTVAELPAVETIYFQVDADPSIIDFYQNKPGLVIAGAGAGEFSEAFINRLTAYARSGKPVISATRVDNGVITQDSVLVKEAVAANDLPPQKAAVLLRLAIAINKTSQEDLINFFKIY